MNYFRNPPGPVEHINLYLDGWYRGFAEAGFDEVCGSDWLGRGQIGSLMNKLGIQRPLPWSSRTMVSPLAWASDRDIFPAGFNWRIIPWIYDCWEPDFNKWERLLRRLRITTAFFSARLAAEEFSNRLPNVACHWLPEAVDPSFYDPGRLLSGRPIDVLDIGRRFERMHSLLDSGLRTAGIIHRSGPLRSPDGRTGHDALRAALASTRMPICYPKSLTHPNQAGRVETATYRYFEGFASRCLVVGQCPAELRDLWGFNPVADVDPSAPLETIIELARSIERHQELVDKNYARLMEAGCWVHRACTALNILSRNLLSKETGPVAQRLTAARKSTRC